MKIILSFSCCLMVLFFFQNGMSSKQLKNKIHAPGVQKTVTISEANGIFTLLRNGKPYYIKGAGYSGFGDRLDELASAGANSIRTWGTFDYSQSIFDAALSNNLSVMAGLWVEHEEHGFDYSNRKAVIKQLISFSNMVEKYKNHPALLIWGVGNELNMNSTNDLVWNAVEEIVKMIHRIDPNHPTATVIAGIWPEMLEKLHKRCPSIDIIAINSYGGLDYTLNYLDNTEWNKPYMLSEWGPSGDWEWHKTSWGAPIDFLSGDKFEIYQEDYQLIQKHTNRCVGSYVFWWGYNLPPNSTWYDLLLEPGTRSAPENAMQHAWSGTWPSVQPPHLIGLRLNGLMAFDDIDLDTNTNFIATVEITNTQTQDLQYIWQVYEDPLSNKAATNYPALFCFTNRQNSAAIQMPNSPGFYRLFVRINDGKSNAAVGNIPFKLR